MNEEKHDEIVYEKVSQITGLKFKSLLKNSGIEFEEIYYVKNMVNDNETFRLQTNEKAIFFKNKTDFIVNFHNLILDSLSKLNKSFEELQRDNRDYLIFGGEKHVFYKHEEIATQTEKQTKLLEKFKYFYSKIL
ncbi:hypothetical protein [Tenacibaculum amylolyticum]|uniref:hypothetical protein n=1 Tax=Tenacibaculum amylolyticum TaxID=104269 RepID=UPI0038953E52